MVHRRSVKDLTALLLALFSLHCVAKEVRDTDASLAPGVRLVADLSRQQLPQKHVYDFFDVSVRTEKASNQSIPATFGRRPKVNTVRMLGGWPSRNLHADTYKWTGDTYIYDFSQATQRIDSWLNNGWDIFQIVLDNPPWAFQRGFHFVDQPDGIHYLKKDAIGVYGNNLPPADAGAWHDYIRAFTRHLIYTYGKDRVLSWRFRVGSEIDTRPQHWAGTREAFFNHYKNTVDAVHSELPNAQVGVQFREASFTGKYVDFRGSTEDAYGPYFVRWAKANKVPYDFLGISYYPRINEPDELDPESFYTNGIAPIQRHPDWNTDASLEVHEFKLIIAMQRAGFESVQTSHSSAFFAMFAKMVLENSIGEVFQWGNVSNGQYAPEARTQLALYGMLGNELVHNTVEGSPRTADNKVNGLFTRKSDSARFDILLYNFNTRNLAYQEPEPVELILDTGPVTANTFHYRIGRIDRSNHPDQRFFEEHPKSHILEAHGGWRKASAHLTTSLSNALNDHGKHEYLKKRRQYEPLNAPEWSEWKKVTMNENSGESSVIRINTTLPSFAVQKIQIRPDGSLRPEK